MKTLTIAIPALNEEVHIKMTLKMLLSQVIEHCYLEKIIVVSDGSTDRTVQITKSIKSNKIEVWDEKERVGKPKRMNQVFENVESDIVVIFDADLIFKDKNVVNKMILPFVEDDRIQLVSGYAYPYQVKTIAQRIAAAGLGIWERAKKETTDSEMYYCGGPVRAFGKKLYKKLKFPDNSADDVYPYLFMDDKTHGFKYIPDTDVCYKLPENLKDFVKQTRRFLKSPSVQEENCGSELVHKYFTINTAAKIKSFAKEFVTNPIWTASYAFVSIYIHLLEMFDKTADKSTWEIISSTKK